MSNTITATASSAATSNADMALDLFPLTPLSSNPIIGLAVEMPSACRCGSNSAVIGSSKSMHAAALRCTACGRFAGWLPGSALDFIDQTIRQFGRPVEPIILRDFTGGNTMSDKKYDNSGALFKNDRKRDGENDRDYSGSLTIGGVEYWLSGWVRQGKSGKFIGLSVKPKDAQPAKPTTEKLDDEIPF